VASIFCKWAGIIFLLSTLPLGIWAGDRAGAQLGVVLAVFVAVVALILFLLAYANWKIELRIKELQQ
jgi:hypothetical protein